MDKFTQLSQKTKALEATVKDFGGSISSLRQKIDLLQSERDLIDPGNLTSIRQYNSEIKKLTKEMDRLEKAGDGSFQNWANRVFDKIPEIANSSLLLGATAVGFMGKQAMGFDEGMSKVNITAQLDDKGRDKLAGQIRKIAVDNKVDIGVSPVGFEKILSQVGSVEGSLPILDAAMKGSKAGFVELDTVAGALAQTMSIVGDQASAMEVLDTFFASKRVGAGEFADFAKYMPGLIAGADNLGVRYKEVAGIFAYMTGKGQSAEKAAVLMENMFSVLGRGEIREKLALSGINVFDDQGKIRSTINIFTDLKKVVGGFSDEQKSSFLEKMGIVDKEAKNAISVMLSDIGKLTHAIGEVGNATGETDKTLRFSRNSVMKATEVWTSFKNIGAQFGTVILPVINAGLFAATLVLDGINAVLTGVTSAFSWWYDMLASGHPLIWGVTAVLGVLTIGFITHTVATNSLTLATKAKMAVDFLVMGATKTWTAIQWALNAAFYASPIGKIAVVIGVVTSAIMWAWQKFEGFRRVVYGTWEVMKLFGSLLWDAIIGAVKNLIEGLGSLGSALLKLFKGDFKGAAADAAEGASKLFKATPMSATVELVGKVKNADFKGAWENGKQKGTQSWQASQQPELNDPLPVNAPVPEIPDTGTQSYEELMKALGGANAATQGASGVDKTIQAVDLDDQKIASLRGSTDYNAIVSKLQPHQIVQPQTAAAPLEPQTPQIAVSGNTQSLFASVSGSDPTDYNKAETPKENYLRTITGHVARIAATLALPVAVAAQPATTAIVPSSPASIVQVSALAPTQPIPVFQPVIPQQASAMAHVPPAVSPQQPAPVMNLSVPDPILTPSSVSATAIPEFPGESLRQELMMGMPQQRTTVEKVCDQIVINVQNGDTTEARMIAERVMEEIRKAIDNEA